MTANTSGTAREALISIREVSVAYGSRRVLDRVSLDVYRGEIVALGKSFEEDVLVVDLSDSVPGPRPTLPENQEEQLYHALVLGVRAETVTRACGAAAIATALAVLLLCLRLGARQKTELAELHAAFAAGTPVVVRAATPEDVRAALARPEVASVLVPADRGDLLALDLTELTYGA